MFIYKAAGRYYTANNNSRPTEAVHSQRPHLPSPPSAPRTAVCSCGFSVNRRGGEVKVKDRRTETDREDRLSQREQVSQKKSGGNTESLCWEKTAAFHCNSDR